MEEPFRNPWKLANLILTFTFQLGIKPKMPNHIKYKEGEILPHLPKNLEWYKILLNKN